MKRLLEIPLVAHLLDELHFWKHDRKMARLRARDKSHPITLEDDFFGVFQYSRSSTGGSFGQRREWGGKIVSVTIHFSDGNPENPDMKKAAEIAREARKLWVDEAEWAGRLKAAVLAELIELDYSNALTSRKEMAEGMMLFDISFYNVGSFSAVACLPGPFDGIFSIGGSYASGEVSAEFSN